MTSNPKATEESQVDQKRNGDATETVETQERDTKRARLDASDKQDNPEAAATNTQGDSQNTSRSSNNNNTNKGGKRQNKQGSRFNRQGERHRDGRPTGNVVRERDQETTTRTRTAGSDEDDDEGGPRLPKRKVAISFGYCGIGYSGLQINHDVKTIEGDIFEAFCQAGAISKDNAVNPNKVGLQRAARTDRGVHAAGNLLTMKLILEPPGIGPGELVERVNAILPDLIRIWGFTRVQNSFNARTSCDSRQYEYLLPTYVFLPPKPGSHMHNTMQKWATATAATTAGNPAGEARSDDGENGEEEEEEYKAEIDYLLNHPFWRKHGLDKTFQEDTAAKKKWRISQGQLARVREIFSKYEGSHNFHNFTLGKAFRDRSAHRHMIKLTIAEPTIINGTEWLSIKFHGQSFMLHQIRKMIGLLVMIGRTSAPASLVPETFGPARIHVPKAPGLGLLLEEPIFAGYNRRLLESMKRQGEGPVSGNTGDGGVLKEPVVFERFADKMQAFKQRWIYDRIHQEEEEKHEYVKFLQYLDVLTGPDFEYLNPKGVIPQSAILKVGEQVRAQPTKRDAVNAGAATGAGASSANDGQASQPGTANANEDDDHQHHSDDEDDEALLQGNQAELEG